MIGLLRLNSGSIYYISTGINSIFLPSSHSLIPIVNAAWKNKNSECLEYKTEGTTTALIKIKWKYNLNLHKTRPSFRTSQKFSRWPHLLKSRFVVDAIQSSNCPANSLSYLPWTFRCASSANPDFAARSVILFFPLLLQEFYNYLHKAHSLIHW